MSELESQGFRVSTGGAHGARSMMLTELEQLLAKFPEREVPPEAYRYAIEEENCLGKRSGRSRILTCRHLVELYALDSSVPLFRGLQFFWQLDPDGHRLLALLCAFARDEVLRAGAPFILRQKQGERITTEDLQGFLSDNYPDRFSEATRKSVAQNINATFTKAGLLQGRYRKIRSKPAPTPGSAAYALFIGHLMGVRGELLLETEYAQLLDCDTEKIMDLAEQASRRGWMVFKRIGQVIEVGFPKILHQGD
ncbi:hypothetical protein [Halorhodospira halophila]|uniref:hypothetical protein n=1 Tax=Halorhodospira halophila TaxID=1053 RepID=UPI0019127A5A|nr:hypothetical protein [Halorhodospira halophila]MBK5942674.1 hypothetical protein [Halorhodospira halophila]